MALQVWQPKRTSDEEVAQLQRKLAMLSEENERLAAVIRALRRELAEREP